ncbi:MAG TPA: hypothetical protein VIG44_13125 [Thermomicrobiales bacterium]|jgi:hypothetical protein
MNEMEAWTLLTEQRRQADWINEHDWKIEKPVRRSLRVAIARALRTLAQRIAPTYPETERRTDALAQ